LLSLSLSLCGDAERSKAFSLSLFLRIKKICGGFCGLTQKIKKKVEFVNKQDKKFSAEKLVLSRYYQLTRDIYKREREERGLFI
jgi:hypothetical protein